MTDTVSRRFAPALAGRTGLYVLAGGLFAVVALVAWMGISMLIPPQIIYEIDVEKLLIRTANHDRADAKVILLSKIWDASPILLRGREQRMANEKPGYCVGLFYFANLGEAYLASNCNDRALVLRTAGELAPVVITPPDIEAFRTALRAGRSVTFDAPRDTGGAGAVVAGMALTLFGLGGWLVVALVIAPKRLRYEIVGDSLVVQTLRRRFTIALPGARVKPHRPLMGDRLSGVNLPGYWVGSWMVDNMATSVYGSAKADGVLLEGEGRHFFTPQDCQGFLDALVAAGATLGSATLHRRR